MRFAIWLTIMLFWFAASASTAKPPKAMKRKPASEVYEMRVYVIFGERSTEFLVTSSGNDGVLKISQKGVEGQKQLDESEIELLLQTYTKLPAGNDVPDVCYRSRIDIVMVRSGQPQEAKASCFGVESPTEPPFRHFANLLAQPF
jgi:hypothetical protein